MSRDINFSIDATNPAQLPIIPLPFITPGIFPFGGSTFFAIGMELEFTTVATPGTAQSKFTVTGASTSTIFAGVTQLALAQRQANAPYVFRAKATYKQGNTPHNLVVYSAPVNYTTPTLAIGQTFAGGTVFTFKQYGSSGYTGITQASILYTGTITPNPRTYDQASATTNPTGNTTGYTNWRIMTYPEAFTIFSYKGTGVLGNVVSTLLGNNKEHWTSTGVIGSFNPPKAYVTSFDTSTTFANNQNSRGTQQDFWSGYTDEAYYRPVRVNTVSTP